MWTQPGPAGLSQHLEEDLSGGDSSCPHVPPRAGELLLPGLGRMKLHVTEEPVPVHTLVWRNCFQSFWQLTRIFHLERTTNDHI